MFGRLKKHWRYCSLLWLVVPLSIQAKKIEESFDQHLRSFPGEQYADWTLVHRTGEPDAPVSVDEYGVKISREKDVAQSHMQQAGVFYTGKEARSELKSVAATMRYVKRLRNGRPTEAKASWFGFIIGASVPNWSTPGWLVAFNPAGGIDSARSHNGVLGIWRNPGNRNNLYSTEINPYAFVELKSPLQPNMDYRLSVEIEDDGTTILARLYAGDDDDESQLLGELRYQLTGSETINPNGFVGWRSSFADGDIDFWVRDVEIGLD